MPTPRAVLSRSPRSMVQLVLRYLRTKQRRSRFSIPSAPRCNRCGRVFRERTDVMRKFLLGATIGLTALLLSWDGGVAFHVKQADARLGRPLTPFSVAGVHRR